MYTKRVEALVNFEVIHKRHRAKAGCDHYSWIVEAFCFHSKRDYTSVFFIKHVIAS